MYLDYVVDIPDRRILYESSKNKKADFLWEMVHMSYDVACEPALGN